MKTTETSGQAVQSSLGSILKDFWAKDELNGHFDKIEPTINIIESNVVYKIKVSAPGLRKKDFNVVVQGRELIISAEHSTEKEQKNENYVRKEFSASSFSRSFHLPDNISLNQIKANYKDGLLNIIIKRAIWKNTK